MSRLYLKKMKVTHIKMPG